VGSLSRRFQSGSEGSFKGKGFDMAGKLVLTIRENDWFVVGDAIIKIERISGVAAKVSIRAPKDVKILRGKLILKEEGYGKTLLDLRCEHAEIEDIAVQRYVPQSIHEAASRTLQGTRQQVRNRQAAPLRNVRRKD